MVGIDAYSLSAAVGLGREAASKIAWCESNISALAQVVVNQRAAVGLQDALARRAGQSRAATPPRAASPPAQRAADLGAGPA
jgi:hypothetical protein